jgi:Domain of Unknown Function (DUF1080)
MRFVLLSALVTVAITVDAAAQEKAKHNTLTPTEIADGWILLFDGETLFGWDTGKEEAVEATPGDAVSKVTTIDGSIVLDRGRHSTSSTPFRYFELQAEYRIVSKQPKSTEAALTHYLRKGDRAEICSSLESGRSDRWGQLTVRQARDAYFFNDQPDGKRFDGKRSDKDYHLSQFSFSNTSEAVDAKFLLRSIKLRPLELKQLFNGKDLTGWHVFPGKKSTFTVEDSAIVCKNGPGDLQSDGTYRDFVLQLECKSNGKHLNSGIFFRCKANEYQNGYEAQIHNNFTADPPKQYTVEEYDWQTHELWEKHKVQSAAVDYGTGAIYRRVPARKAVAKDGEWFTMTIVAQGNHIATWVNGIQQVDWNDDRPRSDNPRTGCRLEAGHISIQGHDPTTDLSFRNIRIAELPAK